MSATTSEWIIKLRYRTGEEFETDMNFVLTIYAIIGIAIHNELGKEINELYEEYQSEAVLAYRESPLFNHPSFRSYVATDEKEIIKVASLYAMHEKEGAGRDFILKYLHKGYKRIFDYMQRSSKLRTHDFLEFMRRTGYVSESRITILLGIAMYIGGKEVIQYDDSFTLAMIQNLVSTISKIINADDDISVERSENELPTLRAFQSLTDIKFSRIENMDELLDKIEKKMRSRPDLKRKSTLKLQFDELYKLPFYRYLKPLSAILRMHGLNDMNFYDKTNIERDDLIDAYIIFKDAETRGRLTENEFEGFLVASLLITMMVKQYKELRNAYIDSENEAIYEAVRQMHAVKEREKELKDEEQQYNTQIRDLSNKWNQSEEYIAKLERQIKEQSQLTNEDSLLRKEVIALREYVFREQQEEPPADATIEKPNLDDLKIAIVGGHPRWHTKIKSVYPSIRTINPDETNIDYSFLANMDVVCFETGYANHTIYKRTLNALNDSDVILHYFNGQRNVEQLAMELRKLTSS